MSEERSKSHQGGRPNAGEVRGRGKNIHPTWWLESVQEDR